MKQLPMTPELAALISKAVGPDVDTSKLAVFETIALNTLPLPGKAGSLFENAVVEPITLLQMADSINGGNHLPLISDHDLMGEPKGRVFHAGLEYTNDGVELRQLFYLDETEATTIAKLNAGSLDEVSVAFLSTQFLCSECGFDYMSEGEAENIWNRTCGANHTIGEDGVHGRMIGLNQFIETSLVARGAADKPKIVGKSESKLAPATALRLAAKGFEPNALVVQASRGKEPTMDTAKLVADLITSNQSVATLGMEKTQLSGQVTQLTTDLEAARARVAELEGELATANTSAETVTALTSEKDAAVATLQENLNDLRVATGEAKLEGDALPKDVATLKAEITKFNANLTALIPTGGVSQGAGSDTEDKPNPGLLSAAFGLRK